MKKIVQKLVLLSRRSGENHNPEEKGEDEVGGDGHGDQPAVPCYLTIWRKEQKWGRSKVMSQSTLCLPHSGSCLGKRTRRAQRCERLGEALGVQGQQLRSQVDLASNQAAQAGGDQERDDLGVRVAQRVAGGVQVRLQGDRQRGDAGELGQVVARPQVEQPAGVAPFADVAIRRGSAARVTLIQINHQPFSPPMYLVNFKSIFSTRFCISSIDK